MSSLSADKHAHQLTLFPYLSALSNMWRGSSPTGNMSGASWSLSVCISTKRHLSWTMTNGSSGHLLPGVSSVMGLLSQVRGSVIPENPEPTGINFTCLQLRHMICTWVALDICVDAPIIIPGIRTSLDKLVACVAYRCYYSPFQVVFAKKSLTYIKFPNMRQRRHRLYHHLAIGNLFVGIVFGTRVQNLFCR